jgi:hypothetical protein
MRGGHKEGHAEGCICSPTAQASGLDRHTNARDQHNMVCHESIDKAFSYRPYPDSLLISWVAYLHIHTGCDLELQAAYAIDWIL